MSASGVGVAPVAEFSKSREAWRFHLMPSRISELVMVLGDPDPVFGKLDSESGALPANYRSHGGSAEAEAPPVIHNASNAPGAGFFRKTRNEKPETVLYTLRHSLFLGHIRSISRSYAARF